MTDPQQTLGKIDVKALKLNIDRTSASEKLHDDITGRVLSVRRVTLPIFEIVYRDVEGAREDALAIKSGGVLTIGRTIDEVAGAEMVLELSVSERPFSVSLLFRLVSAAPNRTTFEWWARRNTDSDLLELWLASLMETGPEAEEGSLNESAEDVRAVMELYRRCLATNPFDVLGIHWTSNGELVSEAARTLSENVNAYLARPTLSPRLAEYLRAILGRVQYAASALSSLDTRRAVRGQVVPEREIKTARKQAEYVLQLAQRTTDPRQIGQAMDLLDELTF